MKNTLFSLLALLLALLIILLCALTLPALLAREGAVDTAATGGTVIVIDAGHGGRDGGAAGADGTLEKHVNLAVARRVAALCRAAGYTVVMTRDGDYSLGEDAPKGQKKSADLKGRLAVANAQENAVLLSIHMNTFPLPSCRGTQVWYGEGDARSRELAATIQEGVRDTLQTDNHRKTKVATSAIYLLKHATCPAVLVECGFLSNEADCKALVSAEYQAALALLIYSGIAKNFPPSPCAT